MFGLCPTGLRGKPGHQALAIEPSVWAWLQTGAPGFLRAGSHLLFFRYSLEFFEPFLVWPLT